MVNRIIHTTMRYAHLSKEFASEEIQIMNGPAGSCHKSITLSGGRWALSVSPLKCNSIDLLLKYGMDRGSANLHVSVRSYVGNVGR